MMIDRIGLRFRDDAGSSRAIALARNELHGEEGGIAISARTQPIEGGVVVRAMISNRSGTSVRLDSIRFDLATGFRADAPARFFKHGYQSWSASHPVDIGAASHPLDGARAIVRLAHQSEVRRPIELEAATSELFTIVESSASHERFLAGFVGAANQLTTITVRSPDRAAARAFRWCGASPWGRLRSGAARILALGARRGTDGRAMGRDDWRCDARARECTVPAGLVFLVSLLRRDHRRCAVVESARTQRYAN